jgi:FkbM family methyltransferase
VTPDSALRYWAYDLEPVGKGLFDFALEYIHPGAVVWDLGANVGLFTFSAAFLAGSAGRIVAVEADTFLVGLLGRSALDQPPGRAPVVVVPAAASRDLGLAEFQVARRGRSSNFLATAAGAASAGGVRETTTTVTVTLDWLADRLPKPDVVKIDVEGAESDVLAGADGLIGKKRPIILCEVFERNQADCTRFFDRHGYTLYDLDDRGRGPIPRAAHNTIAVPPDRA